MLNLIRNRFLRMPDKIHIMIIAVVIMPLFIGAAIFFSENFTTTYKVALISDHAITVPENPSIQIESLNEQPAISTLALGKYTAFVEMHTDGTFEVTTFKGDSVKETIKSFFVNGEIQENNETEQRGIGTNILGFVLMLVLMQGVALTMFYPEDRNNATFKRILTSPVDSKQYVIAQGIFTYVCLYIPTFIAIAITNLWFGVEIGFGLGTLAVLMMILTALATAFSLFMASMMDRNISLATSGISIITCMLAGCFFNLTSDSNALDILCNLLPQKALMTLIQGVENGEAFLEFTGQIAYVVAWISALCLAGSIVTKRKLKKGI